ncbi:MAG: GAF domain-containing protein, partial [Planctomycetota bacterium]|nr:GAF domain-containing protein [Planctomycetota bacterium]
IIRRTVAENRAFFTANAQEDERFNRKDSTIQKNVTSVVCVPLPMEGQIRGVVYLARSIADSPFEKADMELLSACALQLGLAFTGQNRLRQNRRTLWNSLSAMVRAMETTRNRLGCGDRCARASAAIGRALNLSDDSVWQLQLAGLLYDLGRMDDLEGKHAIDVFNEVDNVTTVAELVRDGHERLNGKGPRHLEDQDLGTEARVLAAAGAFSDAVLTDADSDAAKHIEALIGDTGFDQEVIKCLQACHLDGTLYQQIEG